MSIGLDGRPLCRRWLGEAVGGGELLRYDAPEEGAFRGMMSNGCRLDLVWGEGGGEGEGAGDSNGAEGGDGRVRPRSAFYKRVVMGELDAARDKAREQPAKLARDARSYDVEAGFLASAACAQLLAAGVHAPRAYRVEMRPDEASPIDSAFSMLLSDFSPEAGWTQVGLLDAWQDTSVTCPGHVRDRCMCMSIGGAAGRGAGAPFPRRPMCPPYLAISPPYLAISPPCLAISPAGAPLPRRPRSAPRLLLGGRRLLYQRRRGGGGAGGRGLARRHVHAAVDAAGGAVRPAKTRP